MGLPQPQSGRRSRREPPGEWVCRTVTASWRWTRNREECPQTPVDRSSFSFLRFMCRERAARFAASLSETIWASDQCHLVLFLLHHTPSPIRPPSPMQTDSTLLLQTLWLFSVRRATSLHTLLFYLFEYLCNFLVSHVPVLKPLSSGSSAPLRDFFHLFAVRKPVGTVSNVF